ncbi:MAG: pentapeptide repeat-containing protein, partial [Thermoguttaceae bacterium]
MRRLFKKCIGGAAIRAIAAASLFVGGSAVCQADIYQWTYAADGHTIIQSTALCPGGAGVSAAPGADLSSRDLTKAALWNKDLTGTNFSAAILSNAQLTNANLTGADLSGADLSHADLWAANLTSADLTSAIVNWTNFTVDGLIQSQLYSTASYQSGNMVGIGLYDINMPGWNLAGKDLSYASVGGGHSHLEGADLTGANLSHAASFAPFAQNVILKNANLTGADLAGSNLGGADLTGANLTGASISQGCVGGSNLTAAQLYSTADYQAKDLCQISFCTSNLANWNFADQNLMRANLASTTLTGTDLSRADLRGATVPPLTSAITHNTILSDGTIDNLSLGPGEDLIVRNFTTDPVLAPTPIGIHAAGKVSFDHRATLQLDFGQDLIFSPTWNSTISFDPSTSVKLDGILELTLTDPQDWGPSMLGKSFQLFNWTGVSHSGAFSVVADNSQWDTSHLYTTGIVTLTAVPEPSTLALLIVAALGLAIHLGRCARMRSPRLFGMVAVAAMIVFLVAARAQADGFDWRNVGGLDFTTPPKDQGSAGDCWDFSVVGPLEAKYKMTRNDASYSPDCSEMQLDWDCAWTGAGAFDYVCTHGVVSEAECPFNAAKSRLGGTGPGLGDPWPLAPGWQNRVWISTGTIINTPQNTLSMKACIKMYGSCMMPVDCANDLYPSVSDLENDYHTALPSSSCDHDISVIGYQDDPKVPTGGYWIVKNSWGTGAGTNGYYYVPYGALETKGSGTPDGVPVQFIPGPVYYTGYMANATWRGGAGVWTSGGTNWTNDASSGATYAWQNMETGATFAGIGGNVTLSGPVIAHGVAINSAGYCFSGGLLTVTAGGITANQSASIDSPVYVGAPQTWTVAGGSSLTINGPLHTIISDLTVTGGGSTTISGAIDGGGVLNIVGGAKPGGLIYAGSGTLTLSGLSNFAGDVTHNGSGVLNIAPAGGANVTFSGALNGSGPIVITTTGACSIGGSTSAFTGPITQTGGTLNFIPAASVLNLFNGAISGNCNVAQSGLGATVLYPDSTSGTNTYAGTTTISAGALIADIG